MHIAGKVWGETSEIIAKPQFELHRIFAKSGHRCSRHKHKHKYNGFYVETGLLEVTVWKHSGTVDRTVLKPGDFLVVPPTEEHQFSAEEDTVAFEVYWTELRSDDIEREDHGE